MSMEKTSAENISVQISKPVLNEIYSIVLDTNFNSMRFRDECLTIMLEMWRRDIQVDNDVMAKVMEGLKSSRNYSLVLELFSKMPLLGVKRDNRHVSLAVTALVRTKKISKALALIRKFETAELKLTKSAYIALAFRILKAIRLYPHDEILTVQNDKNQEVELSLEETIDVCLDLFYSGLHDSELYQGWSTVIFDLTIQTMSDPIYYLIDQRIRERLCNLDSLRSSSSSSSSSGSGHSPDHSHEQSDSDSLFSTEQRNQRIDSEPDDLDPPSPTPRPPPSPTSQEELSKYEKEYKWFHHFCSKLQEIRNEKGRPASLKWRRMKSNPLVNELSTINYLKSIEENSL